jgi:hypothetical protein
MVADYLHFAGFEQIEIVDIAGQVEETEHAEGLMALLGSMGGDPLWVVRGRTRGLR